MEPSFGARTEAGQIQPWPIAVRSGDAVDERELLSQHGFAGNSQPFFQDGGVDAAEVGGVLEAVAGRNQVGFLEAGVLAMDAGLVVLAKRLVKGKGWHCRFSTLGDLACVGLHVSTVFPVIAFNVNGFR